MIAVEGCTLALTTGVGEITIDTDPSDKVIITGKGCYYGPITISVKNYTGGLITVPSSGTGTTVINGTGDNVKVHKFSVVLEGDKADIVINGQQSTPSGPVPVVQNDTVTIVSAGQVKVKTL